MQRKMKVVLVEDDSALCKEFVKIFDEMDGIELVASTDSAVLALEYVRELQPDAVVLDLELHKGEGNGVMFLSELGRFREIKKPYILVNTNNSSRITHDAVRRLGADFVMYKHQQNHSPRAVAEFLLVVTNEETEAPVPEIPTENESDTLIPGLRERIYDELNKVAISPKCKGYNYLADAIEISCGGYAPNLSALIGEKYGKTARSVEHAMQNAIDRAWDSTDINELLEHYRARIKANRLSPTVMEFIGYYAAKLRKEN